MDEFPQFFGEYELTSKLGKGGMGHVYKAINQRFNRVVALKILELEGEGLEEGLRRFEEEANAMKKLDHQNVVQVYNYGDVAGQPYIAMKYVEGTTLSDYLKKRGHLTFDQTILFAKQIARGLLYAHSHGIIHRDIKLSNVIVTADDRIYITDFGISYSAEQERLTTTGMAMGTPEYMSPEQCQGEQITEQSDIYSFGIIVFEMLTSQPPFKGDKPLAIAYKQVNEEAPLAGSKRRNLPPELEEIVATCLKKAKADRYPSFAEVLEDLDLVDEILHPSPASAKKRDSTHLAATRLKELKVKKTGRSEAPTIKAPHLDKSGAAPNTRKTATVLHSVFASPIFWIPSSVLLVLMLTQSLVLNRELATRSGLLKGIEVRAVFLEHPVDGALLPSFLFDGDLSTAWASLEKTGNKISPIRIELGGLKLLQSIGVANGYQKSEDDELQDRFPRFAAVQELVLENEEGEKRILKLKKIRGVQYPAFAPLEARSLRLEIRQSYLPVIPAPVAISELRFVGFDLNE